MLLITIYPLNASNSTSSPEQSTRSWNEKKEDTPEPAVSCASVVLRAGQVDEVNLAMIHLALPASVHLQLHDAVAATGPVIQLGGRHSPVRVQN